MLRASDRFRPEIAEVLDLLDELDQCMRRRDEPPHTTQAPKAADASRYQSKRYTVEKRRRGAFLCEYRVGGRPQPFCCPRATYDTTAAVIENADDWAHFDEIQDGVAERIGNTPPDYLIRLCLRFWQSTDPPIVQKDRSRYRAPARGKLTNAARRARRKLEKHSDE